MSVVAYTVAKDILKIAEDHNEFVSNLKIQKLLYYAQAWYMVNNNGSLLFDDVIEARKFGPVVPSVYEKFKRFKRNPIKIVIKENELVELTEEQKDYLKSFYEDFMPCSTTELISMTHNEKPWQEAYALGLNTPISTKTMYSYYSQMYKEQHGK
ncbi:MAG: DUF4065 domain-containing protein [Treponema sp.]|nr:DUF4065 domain-containing protein [Treponema sp.]